MVAHVVSPFDLSRTLPVGGGLLVPCSLPGPPVVKEPMQMVTVVPGQGGWLSQRASPNRVVQRSQSWEMANEGVAAWELPTRIQWSFRAADFDTV